MYYPWLDVPLLTAPMLIAIIALLHVFVSHYAVGGGLLLAWQNDRALHDGDDRYRAYWKKQAKFFITLTVTYGAVTGVGIWFVIGLTSPLATETLIKTFVFGWAIEWCFFLLEIVAGFAFYYFWDKFSPRTSVWIGYVYAFAAWISLVLITAITSFMLNSEGLIHGNDWESTGNFWFACLNLQFIPQVTARTGCALTLGSFYILLHASFAEKDLAIREQITRRMRIPAFLGIFLLVCGVASWAYFLPSSSLATLERAAATNVFAGLFAAIIIGIILLLIAGPVMKPGETSSGLALALCLMGIAGVGVGEFVREAVRKPYVIDRVVFSNQIARNDVQRLRQDGLLYTGTWTNWLLDDLQRKDDERVANALASGEQEGQNVKEKSISAQKYFKGKAKFLERQVFNEKFFGAHPELPDDVALKGIKGISERFEYRLLAEAAQKFIEEHTEFQDPSAAGDAFFRDFERPTTHLEKIELQKIEPEPAETQEEPPADPNAAEQGAEGSGQELQTEPLAVLEGVSFVHETAAQSQLPAGASFTPTSTVSQTSNPQFNAASNSLNSRPNNTQPTAQGAVNMGNANNGQSAVNGGLNRTTGAQANNVLAPADQTNVLLSASPDQNLPPTQTLIPSGDVARQAQRGVVEELNASVPQVDSIEESELVGLVPEPTVEEKDLALYGPIGEGNLDLLDLPEEDRLTLGRAVFMYHCNCCHAGAHGYSAVGPMISGRSQEALESFVLRLNHEHYYMPPWAGTRVEAKLLSEYLVSIAPKYPKNVFQEPKEKKTEKNTRKKTTEEGEEKTDSSSVDAQNGAESAVSEAGSEAPSGAL